MKKSKPVLEVSPLNAAVERYLPLWWTDEARQQIKKAVGPEGLKQIEAMTSFASGQSDLWIHDNFEVARNKVGNRLRTEFPALSEGAHESIMDHAAYGWK
jgi:hypothetical protein